VGFEPTISAFERAKTVHALECAATVTGQIGFCSIYFSTLETVRPQKILLFIIVAVGTSDPTQRLLTY
jgi:hypothetical protein